MTEKHYVFIKNNRVEDILVFSEQNDELANLICSEKDYDLFVWCEENLPHKYSQYDGTDFTEPTHEYLVSIGVLSSLPTAGESNTEVE